MFNGQVTWHEAADPERPGATLYTGYLGGLAATMLVQEVSVGVWGWLLMDDDGNPLQMRNGYTAMEPAKAAAVEWLKVNPRG